METAPSPYAEIDGAIQSWARRHSSTLFREWQGEARYWHVSYEQECFQISVDPPVGGFAVVRARAIETDDDAELTGEWTVATRDLEQALRAATDLTALWHRRSRLGS